MYWWLHYEKLAKLINFEHGRTSMYELYYIFKTCSYVDIMLVHKINYKIQVICSNVLCFYQDYIILELGFVLHFLALTFSCTNFTYNILLIIHLHTIIVKVAVLTKQNLFCNFSTYNVEQFCLNMNHSRKYILQWN